MSIKIRNGISSATGSSGNGELCLTWCDVFCGIRAAYLERYCDSFRFTSVSNTKIFNRLVRFIEIEASVLMYHLFRLVANALTEAENHRIEAQLGQKLRGFELLQESMSTVAT